MTNYATPAAPGATVARESSVSWRPNHLVLISIPAADYRMICEAVVE